MSNLATILLLSRVRIRDLGLKTFHELELVAYANEGKNELVKIIRQARSDFFVLSTTSTIPVATAPAPSELTLPDDFAELKNIEVTTIGYEDMRFFHLDRADPRFQQALIDAIDANSLVGFYYDIIGRKTMTFAPSASQALAVKIYYTQTVFDMSLPNDALPAQIPQEHYDFVVTWVVSEALRSSKDKRLEGYLDKLKYQRNSVIESVAQRQIMEPRYVTGYLEDEF